MCIRVYADIFLKTALRAAAGRTEDGIFSAPRMAKIKVKSAFTPSVIIVLSSRKLLGFRALCFPPQEFLFFFGVTSGEESRVLDPQLDRRCHSRLYELISTCSVCGLRRKVGERFSFILHI